MKRYITIILTLLLAGISAHAQKAAVGTNAVDWMYLVTPNMYAQFALGQHWSLEAKGAVNAWSFNTGGTEEERSEQEVKARRQSYALGARWWPWNVYSGWWVGAMAQYQEYDNGGLSSVPWQSLNEAGDAFGASISAGYSLQLSRHWNLDFGLGFWGGYKKYTVYRCPWCGKVEESGEKTFLVPDQAMISILYVF